MDAYTSHGGGKNDLSAILCYGFPATSRVSGQKDDGLDWLHIGPSNEECSFSSFLGRLVGIEPPHEGGIDTERADVDQEYQFVWKEYHERIAQLEDEYGVTLVSAGQGNVVVDVLATTKSVQEATLGKPVLLGQSIADKEALMREQLKMFCEWAEIPFWEPQFMLLASGFSHKR